MRATVSIALCFLATTASAQSDYASFEKVGECDVYPLAHPRDYLFMCPDIGPSLVEAMTSFGERNALHLNSFAATREPNVTTVYYVEKIPLPRPRTRDR